MQSLDDELKTEILEHRLKSKIAKNGSEKISVRRDFHNMILLTIGF